MPHYHNIFILTGAGISAESGIATFRDPDGLWSKVRPEDVATIDAFRRNPDYVLGFYNMRRGQAKTYEPNAAHFALSELERRHTGTVTLVTQNVDSLHEAAGSENLLHMHGKHGEVWCMACNSRYPWTEELHTHTKCTNCGQAGAMRPNVVWFGEMPYHMDEIDRALSQCDLFLSIGTSGNVYPAAGFVAQARSLGRAHTVELNLEPSEGASMFNETIHGPATEIVPAFVNQILEA